MGEELARISPLSPCQKVLGMIQYTSFKPDDTGIAVF
jgi:hypothetical protein